MPAQKPIDRLIQHVVDATYLDEVSKQVILARLTYPPSPEEMRAAQARAARGRNESQ